MRPHAHTGDAPGETSLRHLDLSFQPPGPRERKCPWCFLQQPEPTEAGTQDTVNRAGHTHDSPAPRRARGDHESWCPVRPRGPLSGRSWKLWFRSTHFPVEHAMPPSLPRDFLLSKMPRRYFPGGPVVNNLPSNAGDAGSIPGWGTKIPQAAQLGQKKKKSKSD